MAFCNVVVKLSAYDKKERRIKSMGKKESFWRAYTIVFICLLVLSFTACEISDPVADKSERFFSVVHFSGMNTIYRQLTVNNSNDIVYVDGNSIYVYPLQDKIDDLHGDIRVLSLSESFLYILYEDDVLYIYDIAADYKLIKQIHNIEYISSFDGKVVIKKPSNEAECYYEDDLENSISLNDIICTGEKYGDSEGLYNIYVSYIDGTPIYSDSVNDSSFTKKAYIGYTAFINGQPLSLDGNNITIRSRMFFLKDIFYVRNGYSTIHKKGGNSYDYAKMNTSNYFSSDSNRIFFNKCVYELVQRPDYNYGDWAHPQYTFNFPQYLTVNDMIIATDLETSSAYVVYQTDNNLKRIIGFDGKSIYLIDTNTYTLSVYDLTRGTTLEIKQLPELTELSFEWCGEVLFVYDDNNNVADIVDINR